MMGDKAMWGGRQRGDRPTHLHFAHGWCGMGSYWRVVGVVALALVVGFAFGFSVDQSQPDHLTIRPLGFRSQVWIATGDTGNRTQGKWHNIVSDSEAKVVEHHKSDGYAVAVLADGTALVLSHRDLYERLAAEANGIRPTQSQQNLWTKR